MNEQDSNGSELGFNLQRSNINSAGDQSVFSLVRVNCTRIHLEHERDQEKHRNVRFMGVAYIYIYIYTVIDRKLREAIAVSRL